MKLSQETIDKKFNLPKQQYQKNNRLFHKNNRLFIPANNKQN